MIDQPQNTPDPVPEATEPALPATGEPQAAAAEPPGVSPAQLAELEGLIAELKEKVTQLRGGELDAASLEERLRELNELAVKAAGAVDSAAR